MREGHSLTRWAVTQTTVSLSSAEAELHGVCRGASQGLGLVALAEDLGIDFTFEILTDASAAIGICRRRGLGIIRHLAVADLWVQEKLRLEEFMLVKIPGSQNPADILTKHVDRQTLERHLRTISIVQEWGRAEHAPTIDHQSL